MTNVDFRCTALDSVVQSSIINSTSFTAGPDANSFVSVPVATMKSIFKIKTSDTTDGNMKFYVNKTNFLAVDISTASMETSDIGTMDPSLSGTDNHFAKDYLRYISKQIFGSIMGVGLFSNNTAVIDNITNDFVTQYTSVLSDLDSATPRTGTHAFTYSGLTLELVSDSDGTYADSRLANQNSLNIGWTLFQRLVAAQPDRATAFLGDQTNAGVFASFPFIVDDTMSIYVTVNANPEQKSITTLEDSSIADRTYRIRIKVVADGV